MQVQMQLTFFFGGDRRLREQQELKEALIVIGARKVLFVLCSSLKRCKVVAKRGEGLFLACVSGQCWAIRSQMAASERVPRLLSLCLFFLLFEPGTGTEERGGG